MLTFFTLVNVNNDVKDIKLLTVNYRNYSKGSLISQSRACARSLVFRHNSSKVVLLFFLH